MDKPCGGRRGHDWVLKISGIGPLWKWGIYEVIRLSGQIGSETSGSCQPCYPQGPEGWIYKQTGKVDRQFKEYRHVLGPSILFFEYRGFPWLWEDTDTLGALLRGESVLIRGSLFEDRLYSDTALPGWNYVFSDSCLEKPDTSYEGTWITAYGLRWRFT